MTTKTKLVWRLGKLPSVDELRELVKDKILTNEEAREILFNKEDVEERDKKSLEDEIKFLRQLVENLSHNNRNTIIEVIKEVEKPYRVYPWYQPYMTWQGVDINKFYCDGQSTSNNFTQIETF